jgi:hypothetical protein
MPATSRPADIDSVIDAPFLDASGVGTAPIVGVLRPAPFVVKVSKPLSGSVTTSTMQRIGVPVQKARNEPAPRNIEDKDVGNKILGTVTLLGDNDSMLDFDANRQGHNVKTFGHFARMNSPLVTINREGFSTKFGINHVSAFNLYGMPKLFRSYDEDKRKAIPFEDFPGRLNPVKAGNYILQYMIITDLTKNVDKFVNPDTLDGVIEVFEVRESFANTSISDIRIKGIKGSLPNENFFEIGKGAAPIDNKFEIKQSKNSVYEDAQDVLFEKIKFSKKTSLTFSTAGDVLSFSSKRLFALENPVAETTRIMSPYIESSDDVTKQFVNHTKKFIGSAFTGSLTQAGNISELGTRFRSSTCGFISNPNYVIMSTGSFINPGTDSIAFLGMNRT